MLVNDSRYWAILICGSDDFNGGFETDIRDMYQMLTTNLGYNPDYIYYVAPSNWNGASHYYSLSKTNIESAINAVAARTKHEDNVFVFYNGHGTHDPWTIAPGVSPAELDGWLDSIDPPFIFQTRYCQQMVVMLQSCYCGGFIHSLTYHEAYPSGVYHRYRIVITSTNETTQSYSDMNGYNDPAWDPNGPDDDGNPNNPSSGNWDGSEFSSGFRMSFRDIDSDNFLEADDNPYMKKPGYNPDIAAPVGNKNGKVSVLEAFNFTKYENCETVYWLSYGFLPEYPKLWDPVTQGDPQGINPSKTFIYTRAPSKPNKPAGQTQGKPGEAYTYTTSTTDPDGDQVAYWFDWGDGTNSGWTARYASGATTSASHTWNAKGTYQIKVKAKDIHGVESAWSDPLSVQMPLSLGMRGAHLLEHLFEHLFERFPHLFPLLRHALGY